MLLVPSPPQHRRTNRHVSVGDVLVRYGLPLIALSLLGFTLWYVRHTRFVTRETLPPIMPATSPFSNTLAASGIVEAQGDNIFIGTPMNGIVVEVFVRQGDDVGLGDPLFRLDDREFRSELAQARASLLRSRAELVRQEAEPRKEKLPAALAEVSAAKASLDSAADVARRAEQTFASKSTTEAELIEKRDLLKTAKAKYDKAEADYKLLAAGSWEYDRDVTKVQITEAEAAVAKIETDIERLTVRALVQGKVLQTDVHPGEFVSNAQGKTLVTLGNVDRLHVRVDIDEYDISRFREDAAAYAVPRGNLQQRYPLQFVRVEPFVVPKKSLTGDNTERVDTRVLQVIYEFDPRGRPRLFVGQQVEVFIEALTENQQEPDASSQADADLRRKDTADFR
ncbi:MAG: HlyD family secretion protein [Planctomycetia bacterium]|nr:HlyD family secretion protein [Planctomycetia bacterium]